MKDGEILEKKELLESIAKRGNGSIYLGVVGAVRTGKSTFIKRFIENLVVPNIEDEYEKKHCLDEIPQSAQGKAIMTTEPKFVPSNGADIKVDEFTTNIKLVDCVGFVIPGATGYEDSDGNPRMVKTPWFPDAIPFVDELIMWIGLFSHLVRLMRVSEFVSAHKKTIRLFVCLFVGFAIGFIVVCFFV